MNDNIFAELLKNYLHFKGLNTIDYKEIDEENKVFDDGLNEGNDR